jgi:two-component system chemotaxis sensor kinase CheA
MSEAAISPELITIYLEDAREHLEALDHCLLALEREGYDVEIVNAVLGPLHTIKGNSGMLGFSHIKEYVHRLEDVFARINDGRLSVESPLFDVLFAGASALRDAVERACQHGVEQRTFEEELTAIDNLAAEAAKPADAPEAPTTLARTSEKAHEISAAPAPSRKGSSLQYLAAPSNILRVDFKQLDHLLNLVGELVIYRTKLQQVGRKLAGLLESRERSEEFLAVVDQVTGVSTQLQGAVMQIRMLPIRYVFERFPRMVRDMARQQGKDIELIVEGEGTRVDKAIIDEIGEPLVHMIRNSIDHGIETPDVRIRNGKTPTGTVLLAAAQESNHVVITIMDDGRGIDADAVRRKAIERGMLKGEQALSDREAIQLIFTQGFSTAEKVTEVSGRGIGLDVVLKAIERLNGLVEVESVPGIGSKFIIQLPLTLAIIVTLLVEVADRTYAIPLSSVVETLRFAKEEIQHIHGRDTLRIRDHIVPLIRLADVFDLPRQADEGRGFAVILGRGDKQIGLVVDHLQGQQEVVIKALDESVISGSTAIAGATIMGDGRVVLIVDVPALFENRRLALISERSGAQSVV